MAKVRVGQVAGKAGFCHFVFNKMVGSQSDRQSLTPYLAREVASDELMKGLTGHVLAIATDVSDLSSFLVSLVEFPSWRVTLHCVLVQ